MTATAVILISVSALMHAGWNLHLKRHYPTVGFFVVGVSCGAVCLAPILIFHHEKLAAIPGSGWALVLLGGLCHAIYFYGLATAYRLGDMSLVYPLALAVPVVLVTIVTATLGIGTPVSVQGFLGMGLVVGGCVILPMTQLSDLQWKNYVNGCCLLSFVAAIGTTGYTILDDRAQNLLRHLHDTPFSKVTTPMIYIALEGCVGTLLLATIVLCGRRHRLEVARTWRDHRMNAAIMGLMVYGTYGLVLAAMAFVDNVSYIAAFRQLSIPIGAIFGVTLLKEPRPLPKVVGIAAVMAGLAIVGAG